jgi:hypothetical protein
MDTKICTGPCGLEKPLIDFYDSRQGDAVYKFARCKVCCTEQTKQKRLNSSPENKARWSQYSHNTNNRRWYGIEPEQYEAMLKEQGYVCACCKEPNPDGKRLSVDHCHETNRVRGLLCNNCNNGLGRFRESSELLRAAAAYLEREYVLPSVPQLPQTPMPTAATTPKQNFCIVEECGRQTFYRLYCQKHYFRLWRTGSLELRRRATSQI